MSLTSLLLVPERRPLRTIAAVGLLFAAAYSASLVLLEKPDGRIVMGDAVHHFVQLRSAVFDGDLHFRNEYVTIYGLTGSEPGTEWVYEDTETGHVRNYMPVGPALLWTPGFLLVSTGVWLWNAFGPDYPLDGYGRLFQAVPGLSGILAAALGSLFAYLTAATLFDRRSAIWATLTIWLSSSAIYYSLVSPTYSHAASMFAVGAFWLVWIRTRDRQTVRRYALLGALAGVAALMRWQDAVLLVVPALDALAHRGGIGTAGLVARGAACGAGAIAAFIPQMVVWTVLYGQPLAIPQGSGFLNWTEPALWAVLFSDNHGLISWTPVIAVSLAGFVPLTRRAALVGAASVAFFVVSWYVNAAVADWWAGEAFGSRRFVSCFPVFVLGLAAVFDRIRGRVPSAALAAAFTLHTLLLLVQYQAFMHGLRDVVPYPRGAYGLWIARFRAPVDLAAWWLDR